MGSTLPFARTAAERDRTGDPRPSLEERYGGRDRYLARVRRDAEAMVADRHPAGRGRGRGGRARRSALGLRLPALTDPLIEPRAAGA